MKRIGYIYEKIVSVENCKEAILNASKHKCSRKNVQRILDNIDFYADDLSIRLQTLDFVTPYRRKEIVDGLSGKHREIMIPNFYPDQCAHHAIIQIIQPHIIKSSYYWSCGNFPGRGISRAAKGVHRAVSRDTKNARFCFKFDVKKFYPSISHDVLKETLRRKFKDERALELFDVIIDSHYPGLPIGNYTSPWFAELYLQKMDRQITRFHCVFHYVRYVDDGVVIGKNKRKLRKVIVSIQYALNAVSLRLKENYQLFFIFRNKRGRKIDFVGRCFGIKMVKTKRPKRMLRGFSTVRKRRALVFMRQSRKLQKKQRENLPITFKEASSFISRSSCLFHTDSFEFRKKYYDTVNVKMLKNIIRRMNYDRKRQMPRQLEC